MHVRIQCGLCMQLFWSKAKRNKATGKREPIQDRCQSCRNRVTMTMQRMRKESSTVRVIPKEFERQLRMRELVQAEMKRRREVPVPAIRETGQEEVLEKSKEQREKLAKILNEEKKGRKNAED